MQHSLESVWEQREEVIYPQHFGPLSRGVFALDAELLSGTFGMTDIDPRWLHHGVLEFGPTPLRQSWIYVTTGLSNPWDDDPDDYNTEGYSGLGSELVLETLAQSDWAISALRKLLAYDILLAHGRFGDPTLLELGSRVPLGGPIDGDPQCQLRFVVAYSPRHYAASFAVASGKVDFLHLLGITESERDYGREHGTEALIDILQSKSACPITNPIRTAAV